MSKFIVMNGSKYINIENNKVTFTGGNTDQKSPGSDKFLLHSASLIFNQKFLSGEISCKINFPNEVPEEFYLDLTFSCNMQDASFYSCAINTFGHHIRRFFKKGDKYEYESISSSFSYDPKYNNELFLKVIRKSSLLYFG